MKEPKEMKVKEMEDENKMTLDDVVNTGINMVCGTVVNEVDDSDKTEQNSEDFSQDDVQAFTKVQSLPKPDKFLIESLNRKSKIITFLPIAVQIPFLFMNLYNSMILLTVLVEMIVVGITLIVISKALDNFYDKLDEWHVSRVNLCLKARIIMILQFGVAAIGCVFGTQIMSICKFNMMFYVLIALMLFCSFMIDHNYKKIVKELRKFDY